METKTPKKDKRTLRRERGRPRKPDAERLDAAIIALRLNGEQIQRLDSFAENWGLPRATAVRILVTRALDSWDKK